MFDVDPAVVDSTVGGIKVYSMSEFDAFCQENAVDIAVLTLPKENAVDIAERLVANGVGGVWNFTGRELEGFSHKLKIENVHLGDSLMTLCYELNMEREKENGDA